jgi:signal transduction histidine kinase
MNRLNNPLFQSLFNSSVPRVILNADEPDFTIMGYNEAFKTATHLKIDIAGMLLAQACPVRDTHEYLYQALVLELNRALQSWETKIMKPFQYGKSWWHLEIIPIKAPEGETDCILITIININVHLQSQTVIEEGKRREKFLRDELSASYETLAFTNNELATANENLAIVNKELEERVALRTNALAKSEQSLRNMIMIAHYPLMVLRGEGWVVEIANQSMADLWDSTIERVAGRPLPDIIPEILEQPFGIHIGEVYKSGLGARQEGQPFHYHSPTGPVSKYINIYYDPIFDDDGAVSGVVVAASDVTKIIEENQRKNDFIGMVSHELKTPLTTLKGYVQLLSLQAKKAGDNLASGMLPKVEAQVNKMSSLINGFLNLSNLESGKIRLNLTAFDVKQLVEEVLEETRLINSVHNLVIVPGPTFNVYADRDKIAQVISNLLSNAIKYSPRGKNIEVAYRVVDDFGQITVKDEGMGIKAKDIERLFDRFYRVESKHTQNISGFGIGLYLCREIIQRHRGEIWVESETGKGSTFFFSVPKSQV